jgi:hypothetical protein
MRYQVEAMNNDFSSKLRFAWINLLPLTAGLIIIRIHKILLTIGGFPNSKEILLTVNGFDCITYI